MVLNKLIQEMVTYVFACDAFCPVIMIGNCGFPLLEIRIVNTIENTYLFNGSLIRNNNEAVQIMRAHIMRGRFTFSRVDLAMCAAKFFHT